MLGLPAAQSCEWSRYPSLLLVSSDEIREPFAAKVLRIGRIMEGKRPMAGSRRQHFSS